MTNKKELLEQLGESYGYVEKLIDNRIELLKLSAAEKSAKLVAGVIVGVIMLLLLTFISVCLLMAAGFALTLWLGNPVWAFLLLAGLLSLTGIIIFSFSDRLILGPVIARFLKTIYDKKDE